jgi:hypothetical protein
MTRSSHAQQVETVDRDVCMTAVQKDADEEQ